MTWTNADDEQSSYEVKVSKAVYILLDRSGSMAGGWEETLGSINGYVKNLPGDTDVYLAAFDSFGWNTDGTGVRYEVVRTSKAKAWQDVLTTEVYPSGGTPLYDAAGKIMDQMLKDNHAAALLVVMTDGGENSSREYTLDSVKGKLKLLEENGWPVVYLGSEFGQVTEYATSTFSINSANVANFTAGTRGLGMSMLSAKSADYFTTTDSIWAESLASGCDSNTAREKLAVVLENTMPMAYTEEEKKQLDPNAK